MRLPGHSDELEQGLSEVLGVLEQEAVNRPVQDDLRPAAQGVGGQVEPAAVKSDWGAVVVMVMASPSDPGQKSPDNVTHKCSEPLSVSRSVAQRSGGRHPQDARRADPRVQSSRKNASTWGDG